MFRNKTSTQHNFAQSPRGEIPRSIFPMRQTRKMGFDASDLIPIMCEEVLPGDTWEHTEHIAARLATPIAPVLDDLHVETFYFATPNRITWPDWEDFITGTDTALVIPTIIPATTTDYIVLEGSVFDHMGILPMDTTTNAFRINVLPIWAYFTIYNEWFRDQNLQTEWTWTDAWTAEQSIAILQDATPWLQMPLRANKRHDYFTSSLPWPQKGAAVTMPLGTSAPVVSDIPYGGAGFPQFWDTVSALQVTGLAQTNGTATISRSAGAATQSNSLFWYQTATGLAADLSSATAATINSIRLAFQTQRLLERDARGGSRYVEQLLSHFGTRSPDYRLQRPEYLGGSKIPVTVNPIAQTAAYDADPGPADSPVGNLGAEMHFSGSKRTFRYAATEHMYIIGIAVARATPTYQQGTRRHWNRSTRLDFYFPVFSHLGEQAVHTREIFQTPDNTWSNATWGYQERWAEYRYTPNEITGPLRSTAALPMDWWHYAEEFGAEPALNAAFITDKTKETLARSLATQTDTNWACQIIMDIQHDSRVARLMPAYSVPGLIDHF